MSARVLLPLAIPLTLGFIGGVIASVLQFEGSAALALGIACGAISLASGALTAAKTDTTSRERKTGGFLRSGLGLGLFLFLYLATLVGLRDGKIAVALLLLLLAGAYAFLLTQTRIFSRDELRAEAVAEFHRRHRARGA